MTGNVLFQSAETLFSVDESIVAATLMLTFQNGILLCQSRQSITAVTVKRTCFAPIVSKKTVTLLVWLPLFKQSFGWNLLKNDLLIAHRHQQGCSYSSNHVMILWNNVSVKSPICLSLCSSVGLSVKLNYASGHRANCAKGRMPPPPTHAHAHVHVRTQRRIHTHTGSVFADRRACRVGNEKRSSCMNTHISRPASLTHTYAQHTLAKKCT